MAEAPCTRAAFLKAALRTLDVLEPPLAAAAWAAMPQATARRIERAAPLDWLPASCALDLLRAIETAAGDDGVRRCSTAAIEKTLRAPLLRAFVESALGTLGVTPRGLLRAVAAAWPLHYQNAGELVVGEAAGGGARVLHAGLPALLRERCWLLSMATCLQRVVEIIAPGARVEILDAPTISYVVRWDAPPG